LSNVNLNNADLSNARLTVSTFRNTDFTGSIIKGSYLGSGTTNDFTDQQLYSTASYQMGDLGGITWEHFGFVGGN
jgi:uncharacterized protein YjbI with pentapeptide repeats